MSNHKIKIKNSDGKIVEIEISTQVAEFNEEDFWKQIYQKRKRRQQNSVEEMLEFSEKVCNHQALPEKLTIRSCEDEYIANSEFENDFLKEALDSLPEKQRRRLLLYYFQGFNFAEIGRLEKISRMAASQNIREATENLKKFLEKFNF